MTEDTDLQALEDRNAANREDAAQATRARRKEMRNLIDSIREMLAAEDHEGFKVTVEDIFGVVDTEEVEC